MYHHLLRLITPLLALALVAGCASQPKPPYTAAQLAEFEDRRNYEDPNEWIFNHMPFRYAYAMRQLEREGDLKALEKHDRDTGKMLRAQGVSWAANTGATVMGFVGSGPNFGLEAAIGELLNMENVRTYVAAKRLQQSKTRMYSPALSFTVWDGPSSSSLKMEARMDALFARLEDVGKALVADIPGCHATRWGVNEPATFRARSYVCDGPGDSAATARNGFGIRVFRVTPKGLFKDEPSTLVAYLEAYRVKVPNGSYEEWWERVKDIPESWYTVATRPLADGRWVAYVSHNGKVIQELIP